MATRKVLSKKGRVILIVSIVICVLVVGASGYLLWRVNQEEDISSEEANAKPNDDVSDTDKADDWVSRLVDMIKENSEKEQGSLVERECVEGSQCPACEWPGVGYCGCEDDTTPAHYTCGCRTPGNFTCGQACGSITKCTPDACPDGWEECGVSGDEGAEAEGCLAKTSCNTACTNCNNKSVVKRYCREVEEENVCDGGAWTKQIPSEVEAGESVDIAGYGQDSDGVDPTSVSISVDGETVDDANASVDTTDSTKTNWSYTLSGLEKGSHTVTITWKDTKGLGGSSCTLASSFTVEQTVVTNPDWAITKAGIPECQEGETDELDKVLVSYTITVTNTGDGEGSIDNIADTLDGKAEETFIVDSSISSSGVYTEGIITWALSGESAVFSAGESKSYTYQLLIPRDSFGIYNNTVVATPTEGDSFSAVATINAGCTTEDVPQTGIWDDAGRKIFIGFGFLALGMLYMKFDFVKLAWNGVRDGKKSLNRSFERNRIKRIFTGREKFEKKIVRKK